MTERKVNSIRNNGAFATDCNRAFTGKKYQVALTRRNGESFLSNLPLSFDTHTTTPMVSWKKSWECPNGASEFLRITHHNPGAGGVDVTASESYTTDKGKCVSREVMLSLDMDQVHALHDMLSQVIENNTLWGKE